MEETLRTDGVARTRTEPAGDLSRDSAVSALSFKRKPLAPALAALGFYSLWLFGMFLTGHRAMDFVMPGREFITHSHRSSVIQYKTDRRYVRSKLGSDGQFFYYIAADPANAQYYIDWPLYRYQRPVYPFTARLLAFGQAAWVPYTLLLTNLLAVALGTWILGSFLLRSGVSPWLALILALAPGTFLALQRDLTEPVDYALLSAGVYLLFYGGRWRVVTSALVFALAVLTRDKSVAFAAIFGLSLLLPSPAGQLTRGWLDDIRGRIGRAAVFLAIALVPALIATRILQRWLSVGDIALGSQGQSLGGWSYMLHHFSRWRGPLILEAVTIMLPGAVCAVMALRALKRGEWRVEVGLLLVVLVGSLVTINTLYYQDYFGLIRVNDGVIFSALLCVPIFDRVTGGRRRWLWLASSLWLSVVAVYLLTGAMWFPARA